MVTDVRAVGAWTRRWATRPAVVVLLAGLLVSACEWAQPGYGPEHRRHNTSESDLTIDNVATLTEVWSTSAPGAETEPIVADGRVYVTRAVELSPTGGVWVRALSAGDGTMAWDRQLVSGQFTFIVSQPNARSGDELSAGFSAFGSSSGSWTVGHAGLAAADGAGPIVQDGTEVSPTVTSGSVVVRTHSTFGSPDPAVLRADHVASGDELWTAELGPGNWGTPTPATADGRVFVPQGTRLRAYALDGCGAPTCAPLWSVSLDVVGDATIAWTPVAGDQGQVFVLAKLEGDGDSSTALVAFDASTGALLWHADLHGSSDNLGLNPQPSVAVAGGTVYVTLPGRNVLQAFTANGCGAATCNPLWTANIGSAPSPPAIAGGVLYVGAAEGGVQAYHPAGCGSTTCTPIVTVPTPGPALQLSIAQGKLFVTSGDAVTAFAPTEP